MRNSSIRSNSINSIGPITDSFSFRRNLAIKERKIMIYDGVDENSILEAIYYLYRFRSIDMKFGKKRPIDILINSCGGNVMDGFTLISLIESMKDEGWTINTTNIGYAFSMGFYIGICGSNRYCYRYSTYLCHDISFGCEGNYNEILEKVKESDRLRGILKNITMKYTKLTDEDLNKIFEYKLDKTYSADDAIKLGIADSII